MCLLCLTGLQAFRSVGIFPIVSPAQFLPRSQSRLIMTSLCYLAGGRLSGGFQLTGEGAQGFCKYVINGGGGEMSLSTVVRIETVQSNTENKIAGCLPDFRRVLATMYIIDNNKCDNQ